MKRCATCKGLMVLSNLRSGGEQFCSAYCMTHSDMPGFCDTCASETSDESPGNTHMSQFGGSALVGARDRCRTCHSIVRRKMFFVLLLPVWWRPRYRVLYTNRTTYVGRRLKPAADSPIGPA